MKTPILAAAAIAALAGFAQPAFAAAASPGLPGRTSEAVPSAAANPLDAFYAARGNAPLWLANGRATAAAMQLLEVLDRAPLDGLANGPELAACARALIARSAAGDANAARSADRLLSGALVLYVQAVQTPPPGMTYGDSWVAPRQSSPAQILASAQSAPHAYVAKVSAVNPVYARLRDAAFRTMQLTGAPADQRVVTSLARIRATPFQKRYIIVDTASATLWMVEDGRIAGEMKVIVGKAATQTPMVASTIYRATLNPYWNVPGDMVKSLIAPRVAEQGIKYLADHQYDVLSDYGTDPTPVDPKSVDWAAVAAGSTLVKLRQRPGPANSMGLVKFGFPNANDIFLHDTPNKDLFAKDGRGLSNGCIRLSDAPRLARWLLAGQDLASLAGDAPEQHVLLPTPVPIFVTYLTAQASGGQLTFVDDIYGRDQSGSAAVASLR